MAPRGLADFAGFIAAHEVHGTLAYTISADRDQLLRAHPSVTVAVICSCRAGVAEPMTADEAETIEWPPSVKPARGMT